MKTFHFRNDRAYAFLIYITFVYHISSLTVLVILYGYFFLNIILSCLYLCIFLFVHFKLNFNFVLCLYLFYTYV